MSNENVSDGSGDLFTSYLIGRVSEYLALGNLFGHVQALVNDPWLFAEFEQKVAQVENWETKKFESIWQFRAFRIILYTIVRDIRPGLVVETGILHGMTSGFVLEALERNGFGKLLSIDLPSYFESGPANRDGYDATLPSGKEPGWLVPDKLRHRWDIRLGKSDELLPAMEDELGQIDLFCHDSEHTYDTMWKELNIAWERMSARGVLVCDNVEANTAFFDFCRRVNRLPLVLPAPSNDISYMPRFAIVTRDK